MEMNMAAKRVLVIDDEAEFCDYVEEVARNLGYVTEKLTASRNFESAIKQFRPDIVVLDMVMPEVDGFEVLRQLALLRPDVKLLIVTGYDPNYGRAAESQSVARGLKEVLRLTKPISVRDLTAALS